MKTFSGFVVTLMLASQLVSAQTPPAQRAPAQAADTTSASATTSPEYRRGKLLFIQCRACHATKQDEPATIGPNLAGLLGRKAGAQPGFGYSPALRAAGFSWDRAHLDRWLEKPGALVPGNTMAFAGVADARDRAALIDYLSAATATP